MAEREAGRPVPDTLSSEEADRLSERFRPSWEPDPPSDPPTVPRAQPAPAPMPILQAGTLAPKPNPPKPNPVPAAVELVVNESQRSPTLVGIQPTISVGPRSPDDLDWELPTNPLPAAAPDAAEARGPRPAAGVGPEPDAISIEVEELPAQVESEELASDAVHTAVEEPPPPSKPSGIGQTYVPKEQGAPAIVLKDDVRAAEEQARAALEAQHRSRRAPTIARMRVVDLPIPTSPAEELGFPVRKRRTGLWVALVACVAGAAGGAALLLSGKSKPEPSVAKQEAPERARTEIPPPPPAPAAAQEAAEPVVAPANPTAAPEPSPDEEAAPASLVAKSRAEPAPPSKPASAKPSKASGASPAATPAKTGTKPAARSGSKVIVRESPF
jgi:hypothetical protein